MKTQIRRRAASLLVLFATLLCCATARAQVKLYIPDFTVNDYNPVTVNIMLDNSVPVLGYSFNIEMPDELEIVPGSVEKTTGRFNQGQTLTYKNGVFGCVSMQDYAFYGENGTVGTFQVRAKNGVIGDSKKVDITLRNLTVVGQDFSNTVKIPVQTTTVTLEKKTVPVVLTLSAAPQSFLVNPGGVQQIAVAMDNDVDVQSLQMDITLPDGFTYRSDGGNIFQQTARLSGGATITPRTDGNRTRLVVIDMMENRILTPGNGDFMTFEIVAPEDFDAESAQVMISGAQASVNFNTVDIAPVTMTVANGHTAYAKAQAEITELERQLAESLQSIATEAPDVKDEFQGEEITAAIETLRQAVEAAYADMTLTPDYDNVMAPAAGIEESIAALVVAAKAAQKAHDDEVAAEAARQEAYKNANAVVAGLEQKLSEALATIAENCPDVKDDFKGEAVSASIDSLKKVIDEAYENKTIAADYDNVVAPAAGIEESIAALVAAAREAQKAHDDEVAAEAARQEAYKNANAVVAGLEQKLSEALATIAESCPDVKDSFRGEAVSAAIDSLKKAIDEAYENKTIAADYDNVVAPAAGIGESIAALVAAAREAQKAHDAEVAAEAARQEAYKNANAVVSGLEQKLSEALATIAESCPDVKDNFKGEAVSASIAAMQKAIDEAYVGKTIVENYDELVAPAAGIETAIAQLVEDAKASQKAFEENARLESARLDANSELASLDKALADALAEIAAQCPDVKYLFPGTEIQQQITVLRNAVNAAYDAKTLADEYDEVMAPAAAIRDSIAKLVEDAKGAQKKFEDDAAAEKALLEAYRNANAGIDALRGALAQALATIAETCPDVKDDFKGEEIEKSIAALKESVKDAFDTKTLTEDYDKVMAPAADIEAAIAKLVESATAAQKAYEEAEAARQAANKAAYEADLAAIAQLQAELDKAKATIEQKYPGYDFGSEYDAIKEAIEERKNRADDEYESVAEEGVYDNEVDSESVMEMIAKMIEDAKTNGIDMILGEELTDSDRIYTLDGVQVARPQKGKVNIVVKSDGRILKTYVR